MILVSGSTGLLGSEICRQLLDKGHEVRALVRATSDRDKVAKLEQLGAETVTGDLLDRSSLDAACAGCSAAISTATSVGTRRENESFDSVDKDGNMSLVRAAADGGVGHFVLVSFPPMEIDNPLDQAKRAVEQEIQASGMGYTILQPVNFMEFWLSPIPGFDIQGGSVQFPGDGKAKISWISLRDVATFAVLALESEKARNRVLELGGPEELSYDEVVEIFESAMGKKLSVTKIPEEALQEQLANAQDEVQRTIAALMLKTASGWEIDMGKTLEEFPVEMTTVQAFAQSSVKQT